ncbi:MAG TPA: hypothetical protein VJO99_04970 [Burkholderiaceae bacterium]|nr:hypothetical protein [Burkholderiaceae bacterium]
MQIMTNIKALQRIAGASLLAAAALMTGCAHHPMGTPVASADNVQKARTANISPVQMGNFTRGPAMDAATDTKIGIRATTIFSPYQDSFALYLRETLATDLRAAGLLDPASPVKIDGFLTENKVDPAMSQGTGSLAARFVVTRAGKSVYDKELRADSTWESSFVGAVAIPAAINQYTALYRKLVGKLLDDPAFRAAVGRS